MPANEQRRVVTEVRAKLADDSLPPCGPAFLTSPCHAWMLPNDDHQRAPQGAAPTHVPAPEGQQRVGPTPEVTPADSLQHMSNAPPIMNAPNPTTRQVLKSIKRVHLRLTRNNVPGTVPPITCTQPLHSPPMATKMTPIRRSPRLQKMPPQTDDTSLPQPYRKPRHAPTATRLHNHNIISQQALHILANNVWDNSNPNFTPRNLRPKEKTNATNLEHLAMPMVHPTMGETITSYKKLMHDPATRDIWQPAFGKDFGGMAQDDNKTGQQGTNSIFVMNYKDILHTPNDRTITYARVVVDFCPQKLDPHQIRITAGGNLINYPGELTTNTADPPHQN
jgi:hypothetical protein